MSGNGRKAVGSLFKYPRNIGTADSRGLYFKEYFIIFYFGNRNLFIAEIAYAMKITGHHIFHKGLTRE
jgi:hypothetical protein